MSHPRILGIAIDEHSLGSRGEEVARDVRVAIHDLVEAGHFAPALAHSGPFRVALRSEEGRLGIDVADADDVPLRRYVLAMSGFKRAIRDYHAICDSYSTAVCVAGPHEIETIDMARRGIHNAGAELLQARLSGKIELDFDTARRLFTLIAVLHSRG